MNKRSKVCSQNFHHSHPEFTYQDLKYKSILQSCQKQVPNKLVRLLEIFYLSSHVLLQAEVYNMSFYMCVFLLYIIYYSWRRLPGTLLHLVEVVSMQLYQNMVNCVQCSHDQ